MKITKDFLTESLFLLMKQQLAVFASNQQQADKLYAIKTRFPKWLRSIVFHPFNPAYSVFLQYKKYKTADNGKIKLQSLHPYAVDFYQYALLHDVDFDTKDYYPEQDEEVLKDFVESRLMSLIPGYTHRDKKKSQALIAQKRAELYRRVKKEGNWYRLEQDGHSYYLPENRFGEHTYIHHYGLKVLPPNLLTYIEGKDFLDVGAFWGDTSILLQHQYKPAHLYAYEPVRSNSEILKATIEKNKSENVSLVVKGLSNMNTSLDIFVDEEHLASCSINSNIVDKDMRKKEPITITTIDDECRDRHVGLIKMDIEGAEYDAISGGLETIKRDKPVLLISLYHTGKDFFEIPPLLKQAVPEYCFRFLNLEIQNPIPEKILLAYPQL